MGLIASGRFCPRPRLAGRRPAGPGRDRSRSSASFVHPFIPSTAPHIMRDVDRRPSLPPALHTRQRIRRMQELRRQAATYIRRPGRRRSFEAYLCDAIAHLRRRLAMQEGRFRVAREGVRILPDQS